MTLAAPVPQPLAAAGTPGLAPWASAPQASRGRRLPEPPVVPPRNEHQRDHDRIVHSTAFRRLVYKTQVFLNHEGDLYRTRMTHSLEVAQIARSIARALRLNEDLVSAIALAHDLGHTPFGHAGQEELHQCMQAHGGFEHNLQSLRVVDSLERRYPAFDGLNLSFEAREGILKHCSRERARVLEAAEPGGVAQRFLTGRQASLEAQLANLADEVAYLAHDVDDGVRSGLLSLDQLEAVPLLAGYLAQVRAQYPALQAGAPRRVLFECIRRMLSDQVVDVAQASLAAIQAAGVSCAQDAREQRAPLMRFSADMRADMDALRRFLFRHLYRHPQVQHSVSRGRTVVRELFNAYVADPAAMGDGDAAALRSLHRRVADHIAGMTDRFALKEHLRLTGRVVFGADGG